MELVEANIQVVIGFKLLGHWCVARGKSIVEQTSNAAVEAGIRIERIQTLQAGHKNSLWFAKVPRIRVLMAFGSMAQDDQE